MICAGPGGIRRPEGISPVRSERQMLYLIGIRPGWRMLYFIVDRKRFTPALPASVGG